MTEPEEILVSGEFAAFRAAYAPAVRPAGTNAVRLTVRRRRQRAAVATAAAVVLAVVVPMGAHAALNRSDPSPVPGQTAEPTPPATPTPTSAPAPTTPMTTPSTASPTSAGPDGRISRAQLLAARVDLPVWPSYAPATCTTDNVRLREPQPEQRPELGGELRYGDVNGDGGTDTIALVACRYGEALAKQVVVFSRDDTGRIVTLGRVVGTREGMDDITEVAVASDGQIRVDVADIQPCCDIPDWWPQRQRRTYAWTGDRFKQTGGPTAFGVDPRLTDLTLTASPLVLDPPDGDGKRLASFTVTVTNKGPVDVPRLGFGHYFTLGERAGGDLSRCRIVTMSGTETCLLDGLPSGARRSYTFRFLTDPAEMAPMPSLLVVHFDGRDRHLKDRKPRDNSVDLPGSR
ncbi:hypothetical protein GCM10011608_16060 [Micromonospora sonchi]|uniref:Uncharacterized protein n=1 Tax=Micromonospora sonchi TaxID=1763543 RepID=A0A917WU08_9ACTN|nr:hypothetical protein [Micromonospora sonchi]GGM32284.1 hypothetical protein GCM10011608_16060 [Micromonospora sonchi]